jgi:hypothetical protein
VRIASGASQERVQKEGEWGGERARTRERKRRAERDLSRSSERKREEEEGREHTRFLRLASLTMTITFNIFRYEQNLKKGKEGRVLQEENSGSIVLIFYKGTAQHAPLALRSPRLTSAMCYTMQLVVSAPT